MNSPRLVAEVLADAALANRRAGQLELARSQALEAMTLLPTAGDDPAYRWRTLTALALVEERTDTSKARALLQEALGVAEGVQSFLDMHKIGLELDRLNHDVASARTRMQWFEERGLLNGVNIAKRYFPELAEQPPQALAAPKNAPRLDVLGVMQLHHDGQVTSVRGRKRQELFALLLEARISGRAEVTRLNLFDALYPDVDETKALSNLKQLIHSLRLELGESVIKTTSTGYALGEIISDAEMFLQTGDTALWRGCYLEGIDLTAREGLSESLYLLLFEKARTLQETDPKEAARVARFLLEADPYNADYLAFVLQTLRQSDNHRTLGRVYEEAKKHFAEVGETLPQSWLAFLEHRSVA
jgi:tetratricopeptide (TPR) repeat protein